MCTALDIYVTICYYNSRVKGQGLKKQVRVAFGCALTIYSACSQATILSTIHRLSVRLEQSETHTTEVGRDDASCPGHIQWDMCKKVLNTL